ncbi:hypothetical protein, partial [Escherichia coli]
MKLIQSLHRHPALNMMLVLNLKFKINSMVALLVAAL